MTYQEKARAFAILKGMGVVRAVLDFSGGNDEGGVNEIILEFPKVGEGDEATTPTKSLDVVYAYEKPGTVEDELSILLRQPIDEEFGSWAGDFSAYGTLVWDVWAGEARMDKYVQESYDHSFDII